MVSTALTSACYSRSKLNRAKFMKHTRIITGINSKIYLREALLEDIVNHRTRRNRYYYPPTGIERDLYCKDLDTISTYSLQTSARGHLELECYNSRSAAIEIIHLPTTSSFVVTFIRGKEGRFKVEFSLSLN